MSQEENSLVTTNKDEETKVFPYLFNIDKIQKPNCKLCQSELRDKAESIYDNQKRKNYSEIKRKLNEEDDFEISVVAIRNHIIYHYKAVQNNTALKEYSEDIQKWVNQQPNKIISIKAKIALLEREMYTIAQIGEDLDIIERRKNAEIVKKLADTILTYESKLDEFEEQMKPVNIIFHRLEIIVNDELKNIDSNRTKKVFSSVLTRLKDDLGDMIIEQ
jgi:hypothetical protein